MSSCVAVVGRPKDRSVQTYGPKTVSALGPFVAKMSGHFGVGAETVLDSVYP